MKRVFSYSLLLLALLIAACQQKPETTRQFIDLEAIDSTVRPQDDFFQFANGRWLDSTEIPASESGWGSFYILNEKSTKDLHTLLEELAEKTDYKKGSMEQLTGDLYKSGMDSARIDKLGFEPLKADLDEVAALEKPEEIVPEIIKQITTGRVPLAYGMFPSYIINFYVYQDSKASDKMVAYFQQGDLGLPTNEYYLKTDSASVATREKYVDFVKDYFVLLGDEEDLAQQKAEKILALETKLAKASKSPVELRDPIANYHKFTVSQLDSMMPRMNWPGMIADLGIETDTVIVEQPEFYKAFEKLVYNEPMDTWKDMLTYQLISANASFLSHDFVQNQFDFYGKTLRGRKEMRPRWKRMSQIVNAALRDALGQVYVDRFFPPEAKERMDKLVTNLLLAYEERIKNTTWMSDSTKGKALEKLHAINRKIGYPDTWDTYEGVEITPDNYLANLISTRQYGYQKMIDRLGKPVDPDEWFMSPPTVNAYYSPVNNEIVFPAGILQPPFFNKDADDAVNYGAIGTVIAHEVTHGFDDQGRKYDADGNLNEWWTKGDAERYDAQAAAIIEQFNNYEVMNDLFINGELTQGENIADLGGVAIAYDAFKRTKQGQSDERIDGFTPDQRFFLGYSKVWMIKTTDESLRQQVLTDPHSPARYRVNGPLQNMPAFYKAFNVQPGDALYRPDSLMVSIW
jgi:putative endopeptidase